MVEKKVVDKADKVVGVLEEIGVVGKIRRWLIFLR